MFALVYVTGFPILDWSFGFLLYVSSIVVSRYDRVGSVGHGTDRPHTHIPIFVR